MLLALLCAGALCPALQPAGAERTAPGAAPGELERYLGDRGLKELLAAHLLQQLRRTDGLGRQQIADRLGRLYVEMLDAAATPGEREQWRVRSEDLLNAVPEADSFDLRINLSKVAFLRAEEIVERHRLRLADPAEVSEAERELRSAAAVFQEIGSKVHRRVETLERREASGRDEDEAGLRHLLADTRRQRSLAMYYAAWSNYYLAAATDRAAGLDEALAQFGWLLNAGEGRPASLERLPEGLLRYEHVARAAIGCGLCESLRNNHETALRWLDAVESGDEIADAVRAQLPARRIAVLARARRWADLETLVRRSRTAGPRLGEVRLLAVLTLEALDGDGVARHAREVVQRLAESAMTDLITMGEVRHVLDLVSRYGTGTLSGEGFIVNYVRGLRVYESARAAHGGAGENSEEPSASAAVSNEYRQAAASLDVAARSADAARFPRERANAGLLLGLSLFYAGDLVEAADRLERVHADGASAPQAEEALWLAVVALDRAVEGGRPSLRDRRDRLGALFLRTYPGSDRAARLLLRQADASLIDDEKAVEILLDVPAESPLYGAARRHASGLLYHMYRRSRGAARDFAALRYAEIAEEALAADRAEVEGADEARSREAAERAIARVRQLLDAVLGMSAPDLDRATRALEVLDAIAAYRGLPPGGFADELAYRRLQIAMTRGDDTETARRLEELYTAGGRWADAAARLMYQRSLRALRRSPGDGAAARAVTLHGMRVVGQFGRGPDALADPAVRTLHHEVSGAAAHLWDAERDEVMRDLSLELDRGLLAAGTPSADLLRRFARLSEAVERPEEALDAWRRVLSGVAEGEPAWYEARYESLRLLAESEPGRAREAMDQHKVLHPEFGPEPWGSRLRELDTRLAPASEPAPDGKGGATK